jgi:hypothetical protein
MPNGQNIHWAKVLDDKNNDLSDNNHNATKASLLQSSFWISFAAWPCLNDAVKGVAYKMKKATV